MIGYVGVEDVGRVLHPAFVEGQIHGGVAQGMGQVLQEAIVHEAGSAQLLTGSFMDYAMPRANDLPNFVCANVEVPTALNPLGVKGVGEAGTVGAMAATMNAICNALASARHQAFRYASDTAARVAGDPSAPSRPMRPGAFQLA